MTNLSELPPMLVILSAAKDLLYNARALLLAAKTS